MRPAHLSLAAAGATIAGSPAAAQAMGQGGAAADVSAIRVVLALLFCLALGAAAIFALRRRFGPGLGMALGPTGGKRIRVVEQHYLGPQRGICLLEIDGKDYLYLYAGQTADLRPLPEAEQGRPAPDAGESRIGTAVP